MGRVTEQLVKVQRPLSTNDPEAPWLLYGKGRANTAMIPQRLVPDAIKQAMNGQAKAFFWGSLEPSPDMPGTFIWALSKRAPDPGW
jgi:hypothetical protein